MCRKYIPLSKQQAIKKENKNETLDCKQQMNLLFQVLIILYQAYDLEASLVRLELHQNLKY